MHIELWFEPDDLCYSLDMLFSGPEDPPFEARPRVFARRASWIETAARPCRICWASPGHVMLLMRVMLVVFSGSSFFMFFSEEITAITCEQILRTLGLWPQNHQPTKKSSVNTTITKITNFAWISSFLRLCTWSCSLSHIHTCKNAYTCASPTLDW